MSGIGAVHGRVAVGHPVDVASGEFFDTVLDHAARGVVPLSLARTYNTRFLERPALQPAAAAATSLPFGPGWRAGWAAELRQTLDGFAFTRPDGTEFPLVDPRDHGFGVTGRLLSPGHGIELRKIDDNRVRLIGFGWDRSPVSLVFERPPGGSLQLPLTSIERTRQARVDVIRNAAGVVQWLVQQRERRSYELIYGGERLVRVVLHLRDRSARAVADYEYDSEGRLALVRDDRGVKATYAYDEAGRIVREERRGGTVYTVRYRSDGRCVYVSGADRYQECTLRYDVQGGRTWVLNSHGKPTRYDWNDRGQVIRMRAPSGLEMRYEFDAFGRLARQTFPNASMSEYAYDEGGHLASARFPGGRETRIQYDEAHRRALYEESTGTRVAFAYDEDDNVTAIRVNERPPWLYEHTPFGEVASVETPLGAKGTRRFDEFGGLISETNWDGQTWSWARDVLGRAVAETNPLGHTRKVEHLDPQGSTRLTEPDGRVYERIVSSDERSIEMRLPGGRTRSLWLSSCAQPIALRDEEGATTQLLWGTEPGELLAIQNASGARYSLLYDDDMRLIQRQTFDGRVIRTEWDANGVVATTDALGQRITYEYDERGYLVKRTSPEGITDFGYDERGHLSGVTTPETDLKLIHDDIGRLVAEEQDGVRVERTLDVMGRPVAYETPFGAPTRFTWSPGGACLGIQYGDTAVSYRRDALGRETGRHLPGAGIFEQTYDPGGRLTTQSLLDSPEGASVRRRFGFDASGFLASIEDSLRGFIGTGHNARGDLVSVERAREPSDFYEYDGNRNRITEAHAPPGSGLGQAFRAANYRSLAQVAQQFGTGAPLASELVGVAILSSPHDAGNRLAYVVGTGRRVELAYDANGQVVSKTVRQGDQTETWRFGWNSRGQLVALTTPNGKTWTYRYDGCGRRIEKKSPTGDVWRFVWMGDQLVHIVKNGDVVESYVHEPGGGCPVLRDDGAIHYILPDQNEAPSEELSASGRLEWACRKGSYGERFAATGPSGGEPSLGQWYDRESGLHYNWFRYYDPDIGRFLSPDPIDLRAGLNAYLATSDPFTEYDLYGLFPAPWSSKRDPGPYSPDQVDTSGVRTGPLQSGPRVGEPRDVNAGTATIPDGSGGTSNVNLGGNTMVNVTQGGQPVFDTFNGTNGNATQPAGMSPLVSTTTWNHGEQWAFNALLQTTVPIDPSGGPIRIDISRAPCPNGCMPTIKDLAEAVEAKYGVGVEVDWPPPAKDGKAKYRTKLCGP